MARHAKAMCLVVCLALAGCATPADDGVPFAEHFQEAAALHGVPEEILLGVAAAESGFVMHARDAQDFGAVDDAADGARGSGVFGRVVAPPAIASAEKSAAPLVGDDDAGEGASQHHPRCFGLMGLCDGDALDLAARLVRATPADVQSDPRLHVHAAAALLAKYKREAEKGGWEDAVRRFGARGSPAAGETFVREVARHAKVELGHLLRQASQEARPDSGLARWIPSPNYQAANRARGSVDKIIIHTVQGSYAGAISWMQNRSSQVSSHYVVRSRDGDITQMVEEKDIAWHVSCWNRRSIGIEHEGFAQDPGTWYTDAMYRRSARLTAEIARRWGIPIDRNHIQGHVDASRLSGCNDHWDPGPGWDWDRYLRYVREYATGASSGGSSGGGGGSSGGGGGAPGASGHLRGAIFDLARPLSDAGNRLSGAVVRLSNGMSVTTGSSGMYVFTVAPGTYTVTASKAGWSSEGASRAVTAGNDTWGSVGLRHVAPAAQGKFVGVLYIAGRSASDRSARIAGATVRLSNGATTTSNSNGYFEIRVSAGTHTATATRSGYQAATTTRVVPANGEVWGSMGMRPR